MVGLCPEGVIPPERAERVTVFLLIVSLAIVRD